MKAQEIWSLTDYQVKKYYLEFNFEIWKRGMKDLVAKILGLNIERLETPNLSKKVDDLTIRISQLSDSFSLKEQKQTRSLWKCELFHQNEDGPIEKLYLYLLHEGFLPKKSRKEFRGLFIPRSNITPVIWIGGEGSLHFLLSCIPKDFRPPRYWHQKLNHAVVFFRKPDGSPFTHHELRVANYKNKRTKKLINFLKTLCD